MRNPMRGDFLTRDRWIQRACSAIVDATARGTHHPRTGPVMEPAQRVNMARFTLVGSIILTVLIWAVAFIAF